MKIFGVEVGLPAFPEEYGSGQETVVGFAADGSPQMFEVGRSRRVFPVHLIALNAAVVEELRAAFDGKRLGIVEPDAHIDLGEGLGEAVYVVLLDSIFSPRRGTAGARWAASLTFRQITAGATGGELLYLKKKVQITGTQSSPELLETNVGKLLTMQNNQSWPAFDDSTHDFHIDVNGAPYQDRKVNLASDVVEAAGNLQFSVALSEAGGPESGPYYADIAIFAVEK